MSSFLSCPCPPVFKPVLLASFLYQLKPSWLGFSVTLSLLWFRVSSTNDFFLHKCKQSSCQTWYFITKYSGFGGRWMMWKLFLSLGAFSLFSTIWKANSFFISTLHLRFNWSSRPFFHCLSWHVLSANDAVSLLWRDGSLPPFIFVTVNGCRLRSSYTPTHSFAAVSPFQYFIAFCGF